MMNKAKKTLNETEKEIGFLLLNNKINDEF